ncbi:Myb1 protein, related [Neospora caninum Liverpool]|uniref:Myb1 protein, related n=1 Tax=Neospora caninum (strain Liverpool) TaxID=572307 RepID=F0VLB4_NEOCL|nr:Myb1 protein, related [Neospora caninum Liverpool]CBZ54866.1 Myb1 protein, related [Neospora caninum Liverpool]CEL69587.1 TPA: Myb1 protein, related [Neospora caninum Liverpool]|eukprot:XP_003884894.1 Myb1 protein, related [Neospora caninum Liverpool]
MVRIFVKGGVWKNSEDEVLKAAVMKYGINNWSRVASLLVRKSAKQCKARWYEWLDPSVKKTEWTRDEEEKLLHLAKLFPTQWRTIAPIVGRTAHQCLEHYEKLLDQAQGNDEEDDGKPKKSLVPAAARQAKGSAGRGRFDDPRRLRPGEIDPHPETKPSRADAIDMQDDEKEMLQEARARLANTRGKKAKRKAREKQLEEARRLASLQKRREMKAAGLITSLRSHKRRREMDYGVDIPFEEKPPPGFHAVGAEETPEGNLNFANISLQQLEGTMRAQEEMKLRREDARKLKRLQEENLPAYLQQLEEKNKLDMMKKKQKLHLPAPALQAHELEEIVRLGAEASALSGAAGEVPTNRLLASNSVALGTPMTGATSSAARTPRREDVILMEAANAVMTINQSTPLEGGENLQLHETGLSGKISFSGAPGTASVAGQKTPNLLAEAYKHRRAADAASSLATPRTLGGRSELGMTAGDADESEAESGGMGAKARLSLAQFHVRSSLSSLPEPQNEIEHALPTEEDLATEDGGMAYDQEEDMEDVLERQRAAAEAAREAEWRRQSQAVQWHLPRPLLLPDASFSRGSAGGLPLSFDDEKHVQAIIMQREAEEDGALAKKGDAQRTERKKAKAAEVARGLKEAEKLINEEVMTLLANDALKHPVKGGKAPSSVPELEKLDDALLHEAREMLRCEVKLMQLQSEVGTDGRLDRDRVTRVFEDAQDAFIFSPTAKKFVLYQSLSGGERVEALKRHFDDLKKLVEATANRAKKAEKKYAVLTKGYETKAANLIERLEETYKDFELQAATLASFQALRDRELPAIEKRKQDQQALVLKEREKHLWMQRRYAALQRQKEELQARLAASALSSASSLPVSEATPNGASEERKKEAQASADERMNHGAQEQAASA